MLRVATGLLKRFLRSCRRVMLDARYLMHFRSHDRSQWYRIKSGALVRWLLPTCQGRKDPLPPESWYRVRYRLRSEAEHVEFNLDYASRVARVDGIALIFFMGMGDYFYATPLIAEIRRRHPTLPILALVPRNPSRNSSPLVHDLLAVNPDISEVGWYDGKPAEWLRGREFPHSFKTFNYQDSLGKVPSRYLAVPMFYEHAPHVKHRQCSLFETFGMEVPSPLPRPLIPLPQRVSPRAMEFYSSVDAAFRSRQAEGVVFLQVDARSSRYSYRNTSALIARLLARNFVVVTASATSVEDIRLFKIDTSKWSMVDSIHVLKLMNERLQPLSIISVASVFWSISSGLGIRNLGMQHFVDPSMHCYWYDNISVVSHVPYHEIPEENLFLAQASEYEIDADGYASFSVRYIEECFDAMMS